MPNSAIFVEHCAYINKLTPTCLPRSEYRSTYDPVLSAHSLELTFTSFSSPEAGLPSPRSTYLLSSWSISFLWSTQNWQVCPIGQVTKPSDQSRFIRGAFAMDSCGTDIPLICWPGAKHLLPWCLSHDLQGAQSSFYLESRDKNTIN